ncbi:MAG: hypothetical protein DHS20C21_21450 [Gemmatimonadota bacterium]|nr:MAG: hypothetical protein DHS20C21_21450 [Gemmatimonadota bacterium]
MKKNGRSPREADPAAILSEFSHDGDAWMDRLREAAEPAALGTLGPYELLQEVSRGGQGVVYRALDSRTRRQVALKKMIAGASASLRTRQRFEREIEAAASLNHRGVVTIFGMESVDRQLVLAMEWIDGVGIHEWATEARANARFHRVIADMMIRVAEALQHAHQRGVLHRDLKPSNVLVDAQGQPHLLDFGLAKLLASEADPGLTQSGQFLGTPAYASPEQVRGTTPLDVRTDVYSLGVLFYEALTGSMPYPIEGSIAQAFQVIEREEARPLRSVNPAIDRDLESIVQKMLEKDPGKRYQSVDAFLEDVHRYRSGDPVEARGRSWHYVLGKAMRRYKAPFALGGASLVVALVFGVTMTVLYNRSEAEAERARRTQSFLVSTLMPDGAGTAAVDYSLLDILESAAARVETEFEGQPQVEARLWEVLAHTYARLWMWSDVEMPARRGVALFRELAGNRESEAMLTYLLGTSLTFQNAPESVDIQREALRMHRALLAEESAGVAMAHAGLAFASWRSAEPSQPEQAEAHYRAAIATFESIKDAPVVTWAGAHYGFAALLRTRGRVDEAAVHYAAAIELYRATPGVDLHLLRCLQECGHMLYETERRPEAEAFLAEAAALRPENGWIPGMELTLWELGALHEERGERDAARAYFRESFAEACELTARAHPDVSARLLDLARRVRTEGLDRSTHEQVGEILEALGVRWSPPLDGFSGKIDRG